MRPMGEEEPDQRAQGLSGRLAEGSARGDPPHPLSNVQAKPGAGRGRSGLLLQKLAYNEGLVRVSANPREASAWLPIFTAWRHFQRVGTSTSMSSIVCALVSTRYREQEQEMSQNTFDQCNDLITRIATADGTVAAERSYEMLDTELAREMLEAIVGGQMVDNLYEPVALGDPERGHIPGY